MLRSEHEAHGPATRDGTFSQSIPWLSEESRTHRAISLGAITTILGALARWLMNLLGTAQDVLHRFLPK
jgi:hypothetical protein